jgi:predicted ATP-binding protein involved in virulence
MELVYLWVEEYKNIHEQGFNFSPRFRCDYDSVKNELTIDENKDFIPDFFGENINVTAIVGKNGSGKSSIFEILTTFSYGDYLDKKTFLVFFDGESFLFKQSRTGEKLNFKKHKSNSTNKARTIDSLYFGNELSTIFNNPKMQGVKKYAGNIDAFKDETFDLANQNYSINKEKVNRFETFNKRFHFLSNKDKNVFKEINEVLIFDSYRRELHFYEMISAIASNENIKKLIGKENLGENTIFKTLGFNLSNNEEILLYKLIIIFRLYQYEFSEARKENTEDSWKESEKKVKEIVKKIINDFRKENFSRETFLKISDVINEYDSKSNIYSIENINDIQTKYEYKNNEIWIEKNLTSINNSLEIENSLLELLNDSDIVRVDFLNSLDDSYNYFSLSSGERNYIEIFATYIYHLIVQNEEGHNRKFLFLFDEVDLGLHPNWQKRLIKDMVSFASKYYKHSIQLIFTSHSPFLLSDIPKQNIIFLDTDEEGNCKVVDGLHEKKETFGANIHTLLSDSFFMEDGLMGEFAKERINKVISYLREEGYEQEIDFSEPWLKDKETLKRIIEMIGEPFLRKKVMELYYEKYPEEMDKEQRRRELEQQREEIDKELSQL